MQAIWRERPPVAVQVLHRGLERHLRGPYLGFRRRQVALAQIAVRAGGDPLIQVVCPPREPGFGWTGGVPTVLAYYGRLTLITLHVAAGLDHYFVRRDRVLQRMLPGR